MRPVEGSYQLHLRRRFFVELGPGEVSHCEHRALRFVCHHALYFIKQIQQLSWAAIGAVYYQHLLSTMSLEPDAVHGSPRKMRVLLFAPHTSGLVRMDIHPSCRGDKPCCA